MNLTWNYKTICAPVYSPFDLYGLGLGEELVRPPPAKEEAGDALTIHPFCLCVHMLVDQVSSLLLLVLVVVLLFFAFKIKCFTKLDSNKIVFQ